MRSYLPKGHPLKPLELGSEPTPAAYVENMVKVFRLVRTAMADHAVCWLNIGDSYASGTGGKAPPPGVYSGQAGGDNLPGRAPIPNGLEAGSLCLIPQRLVIALSDDGWIVRSVVVWHKPSCMPASLAGWRWARCRVKVKEGTMRKADAAAHRPRLPVNGQGYDWGEAVTGENAAQWQDCPGCPKCEPHGGYVLRRGSWRPTSAWEPILMLAKGGGYFSDGEAVKHRAATAPHAPANQKWPDEDRNDGDQLNKVWAADGMANLRDVWTIAAEPLKEKHYAAFPSELVLRCLRSGTSARGYCPACGAPWCRVMEISGGTIGKSWHDHGADDSQGMLQIKGRERANAWENGDYQRKTLGWRPSCKCPEQEPRPGVVLDPFCGSGRTGLVARQLGLDFIGAELNPAYVEMAKRLLVADSPLFNQVEA